MVDAISTVITQRIAAGNVGKFEGLNLYLEQQYDAIGQVSSHTAESRGDTKMRLGRSPPAQVGGVFMCRLRCTK